MVLFSFACGLSVFVDQMTKYFIVKNLYGKSIDVIGNIFSFTYLENKGAAWGIFSDNGWILLICVPIFIVIISIYLYKVSKKKVEFILGGLIVGGAIGNYIDRLFRGYVVDFLDFKFWPIFNLADVFIVCGCILFVLTSFISLKEEKNNGI